MQQSAATRSELLTRRADIALARQGLDVLEEKREQLMTEYRKTADVFLAGAGALEEAAARGRRALAVAESMDGPEAVRSAGLAVAAEIPVRTRVTAIMGVRLADITYEPVGRPTADRGYSLAGTTPRIDPVAEHFEAELSMLLDLATSELRLRRLVDEIGRTTRRVNALETVIIPGLEQELARIQEILDERERQDHFRLKRFQTRRARRSRLGERR